MAEITTTQAFSDGDTVTATKLNNITGNAAIQTEAITNRSAETTVDQANDLLLMYDASATALKKVTLSNVIKAGTASNFPVTGNATVGGTLGVTGASTLSSTLGVSDTISATKASGTGLAVTSNATVGGTLGVTGNTSVGGTLGVTGVLSAASTIELGHASDTTLARGAAGRLQVEGVDVPTISSTDTLTNKTLTSPVISGGTINNAAIGGTTPAAGAFTTLSATGNTTLGDASTDTLTVNATPTFATQANTISGTASTPAISPTGDTNTGVFFPSADTIAFAEGGAEAMRIDSSGNVGIGRSPNYQLDVYRSGSGSPAIAAANDTIVTAIQSSGTAQGNVGTITSHPLALMTNNTERLRIDSSGNVLVNSTSLSSLNASGRGLLELNGTTDSAVGLKSSNTLGLYLYTSTTEGRVAQAANLPLTFHTNATERLRITGGGEVYIAGTTDQGAYNLQVNGTGVWGAGAYVNGSDSRIKEDIQPIASGLDVVEKLNPVTYKYKETWSSDQSIQSGFIAQELLTALDGQIYVNGVVQQGGAEGYYSVAYQNLIAVLTKAIQELKVENDSLKSRVAALEAA